MHGAVGEEARRRELPRAAERPEREAERDEKPVDNGEAELEPGRSLIAGDRHQIGERRLGDEGQGRADDKAERDADAGEEQNLDQIDLEDDAVPRAEALQRGDRRALQVDEARHGVGDADAADDERGQPD